MYLQNLPFILNKTVHTFNTLIHDNIHTNRAKHDCAKRCIRHDIPLLITDTTFNIKNKITMHSLRGFISYAKDNFYKSTKHCAFTKLLYMWTFITISVLIYSVIRKRRRSEQAETASGRSHAYKQDKETIQERLHGELE